MDVVLRAIPKDNSDFWIPLVGKLHNDDEGVKLVNHFVHNNAEVGSLMKTHFSRILGETRLKLQRPPLMVTSGWCGSDDSKTRTFSTECDACETPIELTLSTEIVQDMVADALSDEPAGEIATALCNSGCGIVFALHFKPGDPILQEEKPTGNSDNDL